MPLDYMLNVLRDETADGRQRFAAAVAAGSMFACKASSWSMAARTGSRPRLTSSPSAILPRKNEFSLLLHKRY
jgi:hypothetical protein